MDRVKKLEEFHNHVNSLINQIPSLIPKERIELRKKLIQEELDEYIEAAQKGDIENIAKELMDLLYTVYGTIVEHGMQNKLNELFNEVHKSNMSKYIDEGDSGKARKGENYFEPNLKPFL